MKTTRKIISAALLATALVGGAQAETITLSAIADVNALQGSAYGGPDGVLASELGTAGEFSIWLSAIKFDLSSLAGKNITSATLNLTSVLNHSSAAQTHDVYSYSDDSWTETSFTGQTIAQLWDPKLTQLSRISIDGTNKTYSWDVLSGVTGSDGLTGANTTLTLVVAPFTDQAGTSFGPHFNDRTALTGAPTLTLNVAAAVPEPESWAMFALGLAAVGGIARRKKAVASC